MPSRLFEPYKSAPNEGNDRGWKVSNHESDLLLFGDWYVADMPLQQNNMTCDCIHFLFI